MKQNESVKELEVGKDYVNKYGVVVVDRSGDYGNRGFEDGDYEHDLFCRTPENWREATEEEVIEAFKRHLVHRYGKDWKTMKIKEKHPDSSLTINDGSWGVEIVRASDGWNVWNKNGAIYFNGIWVERLEEKEEELKIMKKYKLKQWYPSLKQDWSKGDIAEWFDGYYWNKGKVILNGLSKNEVENNPDFWELIEEEKYCNCPIPAQLPGGLLCFKCQQFIRKDKEPLFVTDDGVKCFDGDEYISICHDFCMRSMRASNCDSPYSNDVVRFKNESNADEYIWRNKPLFSYEDFMKWGNVPYERVIKKLAIERSKE